MCLWWLLPSVVTGGKNVASPALKTQTSTHLEPDFPNSYSLTTNGGYLHRSGHGTAQLLNSSAGPCSFLPPGLAVGVAPSESGLTLRVSRPALRGHGSPAWGEAGGAALRSLLGSWRLGRQLISKLLILLIAVLLVP